MLSSLRKMSPEAKKKVVGFCASALTLAILALWGVHSLGGFSAAFGKATDQGVALFSFVEQNVAGAYDAFEEKFPNITSTTTPN
ncbi:MAG: hypothetical protein V4438_00195 [Patescibacteria group bacterium]